MDFGRIYWLHFGILQMRLRSILSICGLIVIYGKQNTDLKDADRRQGLPI